MSGGNKMSKPSRAAIEAMEAMMSPEAVQRARIKSEQEILAIKLGQLREKRGLKQNEGPILVKHLFHVLKNGGI
jgi:hypothetical protein